MMTEQRNDDRVERDDRAGVMETEQEDDERAGW